MLNTNTEVSFGQKQISPEKQYLNRSKFATLVSSMIKNYNNANLALTAKAHLLSNSLTV